LNDFDLVIYFIGPIKKKSSAVTGVTLMIN